MRVVQRGYVRVIERGDGQIIFVISRDSGQTWPRPDKLDKTQARHD